MIPDTCETRLLFQRALPLERAGDWSAAIKLYEEIFRNSVAERTLEDLLEAVLRIGLSYRQMGSAENAREYLELALALATIHKDATRNGRALNGLAALHLVHGELEEAEIIYRRARDIAVNSGDLLTTGFVDQNLGTLANIRGNLATALSHYQSSLELYEMVGNERAIAGACNNLGMLYIDLEQLDDAAACLERALKLSRAIGDIVSEGIIHINRTELLLARRELDRARNSCDDAFEILSRLGEHSSRSDALRLYGIIYRETKKPYLAETHLQDAIEIAVEHKHPLQEAEAHRELALVLRAQERNQEALGALHRAHVLFSGLRAEQDEADVNKKLVQLEEDFLSLVRVWGESIEAKDRYTSGHCERVATYACRIAALVDVQQRDITWFRMGAFLHDVGKTEVPEAILNKPGRLTDEERQVIEQHPIAGDEMLSSIPFPWDIRPMVRSHHERWDGRGYPDSLTAEEIPYTARVLRIADVFDALTTSRSYRPPLPPEHAFQIMRDDSGSFDPVLFEVFESLFSEFAEMARAANGTDTSDLQPLRKEPGNLILRRKAQ